MENFEQRAIRSFSRKHSAQERTELARELRDRRAEVARAEGERQDALSAYEAELQGHKLNLEQAFSKKEELRREIEQREQSLLARLFKRAEIKNLKNELSDVSKREAESARQYAELEKALEEAKNIEIDRTRLNETGDLLKKFYGAEAEKLGIYLEKEREDAKVESVVKKHDAVFVHGLLLGDANLGTSLLGRNADWQDRLKVLLAAEPTLSASTIREGDTDQSMWSRIGVVLRSGEVKSASFQDEGTLPAEGGKRTVTRDWREPIGKAIDGAVSKSERKDAGGQYNELVVENPKVAGLYVYVDAPRDTGAGEAATSPRLTKSKVPYREAEQVTKSIGLPFYAILNGKVYEATVDSEERDGIFGRKYQADVVRLGKEISPTDLLEQKWSAPEDLKAAMLHEIEVDKVFRDPEKLKALKKAKREKE